MLRMTSDLKGPLMVLASACCFSTSGFFQALAPDAATPFIVAFCRMFVGALSIGLFLAVKRRPLTLTGWNRRALFVYTAALFLFQVSFFSALPMTGVAVGTVVAIGSTPVFTGLFNIVLKHEYPSRLWYAATALALAGLWFIHSPEASGFSPLGLGLALFAGACYAANLSVARDATEGHSSEEAMFLVMSLIALALSPFLFVKPVAWIFTPRGMASALALGIVTAGLAFVLIIEGLKTTSPPLASTLALGEPMGAALLGIFALGEPCSGQTLAGIAAIFASIVILVASKCRSEGGSEPEGS